MPRPLLLITPFILLLITLSAQAQKEVPELWGHRVHDDAKVLNQSTVDYLERSLQQFEDSTSNQIAILTVSSLDGEAIEPYGIRVGEKWKLGTKDRDNGAILLVAVDDRKIRIEVGQGLEGPLPDAICARIIRNEIAPAFRRGDYDAGIVAGIDGIKKAVRGEYVGSGPVKRRGGRGGLSPGIVIFIIILILIMRRSGGGRGGRGWSAGAGWFIGSALGGAMRGGGGGGSSWGGGGGSFGGGGSSGSW